MPTLQPSRAYSTNRPSSECDYALEPPFPDSPDNITRLRAGMHYKESIFDSPSPNYLQSSPAAQSGRSPSSGSDYALEPPFPDSPDNITRLRAGMHYKESIFESPSPNYLQSSAAAQSGRSPSSGSDYFLEPPFPDSPDMITRLRAGMHYKESIFESQSPNYRQSSASRSAGQGAGCNCESEDEVFYPMHPTQGGPGAPRGRYPTSDSDYVLEPPLPDSPDMITKLRAAMSYHESLFDISSYNSASSSASERLDSSSYSDSSFGSGQESRPYRKNTLPSWPDTPYVERACPRQDPYLSRFNQYYPPWDMETRHTMPERLESGYYFPGCQNESQNTGDQCERQGSQRPACRGSVDWL